MALFAILKGECPLSKANLAKPITNERVKEWKQATSWVEWWTRKRHLCKN